MPGWSQLKGRPHPWRILINANEKIIISIKNHYFL